MTRQCPAVSTWEAPHSPFRHRPCFLLLRLSPSLGCELLVEGSHFILIYFYWSIVALGLPRWCSW